MEGLPLQECRNCCESLFMCDDREESTAFFELIRDEPVTKVSLVLDRIFNLSYLKFANGKCNEVLQLEWQENIPLCRSCLNILIQLNASFEEFARVRKLESYISRQIQRVHEVITESLISVSDGTEVEDFDNHFDDCGDEQPSGIDDIKVEPLEDLGELEDQQPKVVLQGPWVVLKRLKSDEIPCKNRSQTGIIVKSETANSFEDIFEDNVAFSEAESNHSEGDTTPVKISEGEIIIVLN
ncbi:unnamed protein product [Allacma fusca]|uniref:Uncharacterized protein n=1 Tax=Allacma fusca TaxID=39272 RepID=A0A8J2JMF6_9HEXA|nr:unnamed protein product [Allacma fusca]